MARSVGRKKLRVRIVTSKDDTVAYVQRGTFWYIIQRSSGEDDGMALEAGPFLTLTGARWHRRVWM